MVSTLHRTSPAPRGSPRRVARIRPARDPAAGPRRPRRACPARRPGGRPQRGSPRRPAADSQVSRRPAARSGPLVRPPPGTGGTSGSRPSGPLITCRPAAGRPLSGRSARPWSARGAADRAMNSVPVIGTRCSVGASRTRRRRPPGTGSTRWCPPRCQRGQAGRDGHRRAGGPAARGPAGVPGFSVGGKTLSPPQARPVRLAHDDRSRRLQPGHHRASAAGTCSANGR